MGLHGAAMLWDQEQGHTVASRLLTATHTRDLHLQQLGVSHEQISATLRLQNIEVCTASGVGPHVVSQLSGAALPDMSGNCPRLLAMYDPPYLQEIVRYCAPTAVL